ncbi:MAG: hypothetical protein JKY88_06290 [Pseudomonadales bacterium]|nr:hypothetical protein [Pseudomonadales bacterium]
MEKNALRESNKINSSGLYTNIGTALENSLLSAPASGTAILLTDGMVDISKDPKVNEVERMRIIEELIPQLIRSDAVVHTVALSRNADADLLQKIALSTGGFFEVALTPDDLTRIFLRMFDDAVRQDQLPLIGGEFDVDSSIEEFTLLVFVEPGSTPIQLRSPDNNYYLSTSHPSDITWYRDIGFELITIRHPVEGSWKVFSDDDPQNRVTILSDLRLEVSNLENTIEASDTPKVQAYFVQEGQIIMDKIFLDLMDVQLVVTNPSGELLAKRITQYEKGVFTSNLDVFDEPGRYLVRVSVDGRTFKREIVQEANYQPKIKLVFIESERLLKFTPISELLKSPELKVMVTLTDKNGKRKFIPLALNEAGAWEGSLNDFTDGHYKAEMLVKGNTLSGRVINLTSVVQKIELESLSVEGLSIEENSETIEAVHIEVPRWWEDYLAMILIVFGNVFVLGVGAWLFIRRKKDEIEDPHLEDEEFIEDEKDNLEESENEAEIIHEDELTKPKQGEGISDIVDAWGDDLSEEPETIASTVESDIPIDSENQDSEDELAKTIVLKDKPPE